MAFPIEKFNYKAGTLGDIDSSFNTISFNAYAQVTAITTSTITIDLANAHTRAFETFRAGSEILFHVSAAAGTDKTHLGKWNVGIISKAQADILEVAFDPTETLPIADFDKYYCQVITIPHFRNLTLNSNVTITSMPYSAESHYGGILALECSETFTLAGGHIELADMGIPPSSKALRPLTAQEQSGTLDVDKYSGWENSQTKDRFLLNSGDGAAIIIAKKITINDTASRIGNPNFTGIQFCRGASDSRNLPTNATNVGGSTILIASESISGFNPAIIAKYRDKTATAGQGICRCYIATNTSLRNDEGLYAYDCICTTNRVTTKLNVKDFGNGSFSTGTDITTQFNSYATVTAIEGAKVSYKDKTTNGIADIQPGALVMIHANHKNANNTAYSGRFFLAKVLEDDGTTLTLNALPTRFFDNVPHIIENYALQIVAIPQYKNFTLATTNSATPQFNGSQGGIFAIAVNDTCDLSNGVIDVIEKGGGNPYSRAGLNTIGNAQDNNRLPIGQGHGSVFILAKNLTMNSSTRIGATYSGAAVGDNDIILNGNARPNVETRGYAGNYREQSGAGWGGGGGTYKSDEHD